MSVIHMRCGKDVLIEIRSATNLTQDSLLLTSAVDGQNVVSRDRETPGSASHSAKDQRWRKETSFYVISAKTNEMQRLTIYLASIFGQCSERRGIVDGRVAHR